MRMTIPSAASEAGCPRWCPMATDPYPQPPGADGVACSLFSTNGRSRFEEAYGELYLAVKYDLDVVVESLLLALLATEPRNPYQEDPVWLLCTSPQSTVGCVILSSLVDPPGLLCWTSSWILDVNFWPTWLRHRLSSVVTPATCGLFKFINWKEHLDCEPLRLNGTIWMPRIA